MAAAHKVSSIRSGSRLEGKLLAYHAQSIRTVLTNLLTKLDALTAAMTKGSPVGPAIPDEGINLYNEVRRFESELIRQALLLTGGRQSRAAELLGIKLTTLNSKIWRYGIHPDAARPPEELTDRS